MLLVQKCFQCLNRFDSWISGIAWSPHGKTQNKLLKSNYEYLFERFGLTIHSVMSFHPGKPTQINPEVLPFQFQSQFEVVRWDRRLVKWCNDRIVEHVLFKLLRCLRLHQVDLSSDMIPTWNIYIYMQFRELIFFEWSSPSHTSLTILSDTFWQSGAELFLIFYFFTFLDFVWISCLV